MKDYFLKVRPEILILLLLVTTTIAVYQPIKNHEFTYFDDTFYVTENPSVRAGITAEGLRWAFSAEAKTKAYWHPLTWISHMIDVQLFGMDAGRHLLMNLLLHIMNTCLLFFMLRRISGDLWPSAFVAALFALHPINVESVAWVAARKNVLSTFFWMLSLLVYVDYVQKPSRSKYLMLFSAFACGLLAKVMLVTLPCVLLLLDYWPLRRLSIDTSTATKVEQRKSSKVLRIRHSQHLHLLFEKIPMMILAVIAASFATGSLKKVSYEIIPLTLRIENAAVSYVRYLGKLIWPHKLAYLYPFPYSVPTWQIVGALVILVVVSFACVRAYKTRPYLIVGWLWYLGTLVPVIGIMQTGLWPALADRWAYVPFVGLFIMFAWTVKDIMASRPNRKFLINPLTAIVLAFFLFNTHMQIPHWQNSFQLYAHALTVTTNNKIAHYDMGCVLDQQGHSAEASRHYELALHLDPNYPAPHINLGNSLLARGHIDPAIKHFRMALQNDPTAAIAHNSLGVALERQGNIQEAMHQYAQALQLDPDYPMAHNNLGAVLKKQGNFSDAIIHYLKALQLKPDYDEAHHNLGLLMMNSRKFKRALFHFQKALEINPENENAHIGFSAAMAAQAKIDEQITTMQLELTRDPNNPELQFKLGNLYRKNGEPDKAIGSYQKALLYRPDFPAALKNLGITHAVKGDYYMAQSTFEKLIQIQPQDADAYYYKASVYARQNKKQEAVAWLQKAIRKGYKNWDHLKGDRNMANIKDTLSYKKLIENHCE